MSGKRVSARFMFRTRHFSTRKIRARKLEYDPSFGSIGGIVRITQRTPPKGRKVDRVASVPPRFRGGTETSLDSCPSSSLSLSSIDLSDTKIYEPEYEPSSEPLHIFVKQLPTRIQISPRLPCTSRHIRSNRRVKRLRTPPVKARL